VICKPEIYITSQSVEWIIKRFECFANNLEYGIIWVIYRLKKYDVKLLKKGITK